MATQQRMTDSIVQAGWAPSVVTMALQATNISPGLQARLPPLSQAAANSDVDANFVASSPDARVSMQNAATSLAEVSETG